MDEVEPILERVDSGERLTSEEALTLLRSDRVLEIGRAADRIRQRLHPDGIASFIIDRNVNYTNICSAFCKFCAFFRAPGSSEGYLLELDQIYKKIDEALALGGTGILLHGGLHPELKIEFYEDLLRRLRERYPTVHLHCFSPPEIYNVAQVSAISIQETIRRLKEAGLQSVPGGGAEILDDDYRPQILRDKCTGAQWIDIMETAHRLGLRTTATMMVGTGERDEHRVRHLEMIRDLQDRTGGFTAFIPWTFQAENTYLQKKAHLQDVGGFPYLRLVAVCRIYLDNIRNIQASWLTVGLKVGQVALRFGANDLGSIMIEENVIAAAGARNRANGDEMRRIIRDAGFTPRQRTTLYERYVD